jgi:hypothetical protein
MFAVFAGGSAAQCAGADLHLPQAHGRWDSRAAAAASRLQLTLCIDFVVCSGSRTAVGFCSCGRGMMERSAAALQQFPVQTVSRPAGGPWLTANASIHITHSAAPVGRGADGVDAMA